MSNLPINEHERNCPDCLATIAASNGETKVTHYAVNAAFCNCGRRLPCLALPANPPSSAPEASSEPWLRFTVDGWPCWCVSDEKSHRGWIHAPRCNELFRELIERAGHEKVAIPESAFRP